MESYSRDCLAEAPAARSMKMMKKSAGGGGGRKHGSLAGATLNTYNRISSMNNFLQFPATILQSSSGLTLQF